MRSSLLSIALTLSLLLPLSAQQVGDANRNYTINGVGSNQSSVVASVIGVPSSTNHVYSTQDPNAPVLWGYAPVSTTGWYLTSTNSVDIGPNGLQFMLDGTFFTSLNPINFFARTNQLGQFNLTIPAPASLSGSTIFFAMAHASGSSPDGFYISQTHSVTFATDPNLSLGNATCNPLSVAVPLTDDSFSQQALGFPFTFFGTSYTDCYVGSNGYVTFGVGSTLLGESAATFVTAEPSIRMFWDDLNPAAGGQVTFYTDGASSFEVCFTNVPEFSLGGSNSFRMQALPGAITIDYGTVSALDGLVGLSPGASLAVGLPLNLSVGPNTINPGEAPYQLFTTASPMDLSGFQVLFFTDTSGAPFLQQ